VRAAVRRSPGGRLRAHCRTRCRDRPRCNRIRAPLLQDPSRCGCPSATSGDTGGGAGGCKAAWKLDNSWQGGFQGALTVTNTATSPANPWSVTFTLPTGTTVSNRWNGTFTQTGTTVTVAAPLHSPALSPGAAVSLGFTANGTTAAPSAVALNQVACTT
jgi:endoglucanase